MDVLAPYREKWREVPGGDDDAGRHYSTDLLAMPGREFLGLWEGHAAKRVTGSLGWLGPLYHDFFAGRHVLELGSTWGWTVSASSLRVRAGPSLTSPRTT